jgi:hypothetical protein
MMRGLHCLIVPFALAAVTCALPVQAQSSARKLQAAVNGFESTVPHRLQGVPTDWADRFLIYSEPSRYSKAYEDVQASPRYWLSKIRRSHAAQGATVVQSSRAAASAVPATRTRPRELRKWWKKGQILAAADLDRDWQTPLGTGGKVGAGMFPAKYSFNPPGAPDCTTDFVVFNTSLVTTATADTALAGTFTGRSSLGTTFVITNGLASLTLTVGTVNSGTTFARSTTLTTEAANLRNAINRAGNGSRVGVSATSNTPNPGDVTVTGFPTAGGSITLSGTLDSFTWASGPPVPLVGGTTGQATIVAYNNLYEGTCGGSVPSVYWAYNTAPVGTLAQRIVTSPVLSLDGTQVAFIQSTAAGTADLVVMKWSPSASGTTVAAAENLVAVTDPNSYSGCSAPCKTRLTFNQPVGSTLSRAVTRSSPFYDYTNDVLYVGDNGGRLRKFTGVFEGPTGPAGTVPKEVTAGGWPLVVSTAASPILTGPVYDSGGSGNIFVGDGSGNLYAVDAATPSVVATLDVTSATPATPSSGSGRALEDPPIVDSTSQKVYAFTACSFDGGGVSACGDTTTIPTDRPAQVVQTDTSLSLGSMVRVNVGLSNANTATSLRSGDFDNAYYEGDLANAHLYVCGNPYQTTNVTYGGRRLYTLPFDGSGNILSPSLPELIISNRSNSECSPVTEIYNSATSTDWVFVGLPNNLANPAGVGNGCATSNGGCIMSFDVTDGSPSIYRALQSTGGTSGIVVDTDAVSTANIYFSTLPSATTAGYAVQATQAGL